MLWVSANTSINIKAYSYITQVIGTNFKLLEYFLFEMYEILQYHMHVKVCKQQQYVNQWRKYCFLQFTSFLYMQVFNHIWRYKCEIPRHSLQICQHRFNMFIDNLFALRESQYIDHYIYLNNHKVCWIVSTTTCITMQAAVCVLWCTETQPHLAYYLLLYWLLFCLFDIEYWRLKPMSLH